MQCRDEMKILVLQLKTTISFLKMCSTTIQVIEHIQVIQQPLKQTVLEKEAVTWLLAMLFFKVSLFCLDHNFTLKHLEDNFKLPSVRKCLLG